MGEEKRRREEEKKKKKFRFGTSLLFGTCIELYRNYLCLEIP